MEDMWDLRIGAEILTPGSMESVMSSLEGECVYGKP
jgi:hypothetical protein